MQRTPLAVNGQQKGTSGTKIDNAYLKWALSEAAVLYLRGNEPAKSGSVSVKC